jgi:hypothetical protein
MWRKIFSFGSVAGLIVGGFLFGVGTLGSHDMGTSGVVFGYLSMLVALTAVFLGVKNYRDVDLGGVIGFWHAFGVGLAMSLVATVFYVVAWEGVLAVTNSDFIGQYANMLIEQEKAKGASAEAMAKLIREMDELKTMYANPLTRAGMTALEFLPVGLLVSLMTAALLRNSRFLPARRATAA